MCVRIIDDKRQCAREGTGYKAMVPVSDHEFRSAYSYEKKLTIYKPGESYVSQATKRKQSVMGNCVPHFHIFTTVEDAHAWGYVHINKHDVVAVEYRRATASGTDYEGRKVILAKELTLIRIV